MTKMAYLPKWAMMLSNEERGKAFRAALNKLDKSDYMRVREAVLRLENNAKAAHVRGFGEQSALELVAALGIWLVKLEEKRNEE